MQRRSHCPSDRSVRSVFHPSSLDQQSPATCEQRAPLTDRRVRAGHQSSRPFRRPSRGIQQNPVFVGEIPVGIAAGVWICGDSVGSRENADGPARPKRSSNRGPISMRQFLRRLPLRSEPLSETPTAHSSSTAHTVGGISPEPRVSRLVGTSTVSGEPSGSRIRRSSIWAASSPSAGGS